MAAVAGVEAAAGAGKRRRLSLSLSLPRRFMCDECTILHIAHDCANVTLCRRKKFRVSFEMKLLVVAESIKTKYQYIFIRRLFGCLRLLAYLRARAREKTKTRTQKKKTLLSLYHQKPL